LPVFLVGVLGLVVNVVSFWLLREGAAESLNLRGAYLEVMSDMLGSIGVILAAAVMWATDWGWVDPAVGALIGVFILPRAGQLGRDALRVLVQAAPAGVDPDVVRVQLSGIPGVLDVHDLHVWTLTSGMDVASAHLVVGVGTDTHAVLDRARDLLEAEHHIVHATLQIEPDDHRGCDEVSW
jgi:cobalt-zinc-cadmium efflux system protein